MDKAQQAALILDQLRSLAVTQWGEADAEQQMEGLHETAEQLAVIREQVIAADLEPRFF